MPKQILRRLAFVLIVLLLTACSSEPEPAQGLDWPSGYIAPIEGATFSLGKGHLPNVAREYRDGTHKGFDFFDGMVSAPAGKGAPVIAVADGEVIRIDLAYQAPPSTALQRYAELAGQQVLTSNYAMDQLRGRQVWLLHEGGYLSRYAHLDEVNPELAPGDQVEQGSVLGTVGDSGIAAGSAGEPGIAHLHFELWHPDGQYFGQGLSPLDIHQSLAEVFGEQALPRYSQQRLAERAAGQQNDAPFPPDPIPETSISTNPPTALTVGAPFAISLTWPDQSIKVEDVIGQMGGRPLGVIDAGNGAWVLGVATETGEHTLMIAAIDQYGQTLSGGRSVTVSEQSDAAAPLEWPQQLIEQYSETLQQQEQALLLQAAAESFHQHQPYWEEPFSAPANGEVVRVFDQPVFAGLLRPTLPLPGIYLMPDDPGSPVAASNSGKVLFADELPLRGNTVIISHGGGVVSLYAHLDEISVEADSMVERGQRLGTTGQSGAMNREVLRWEMHVAGTPSDPLGWLDRLLPEQY